MKRIDESYGNWLFHQKTWKIMRKKRWTLKTLPHRTEGAQTSPLDARFRYALRIPIVTWTPFYRLDNRNVQMIKPVLVQIFLLMWMNFLPLILEVLITFASAKIFKLVWVFLASNLMIYQNCQSLCLTEMQLSDESNNSESFRPMLLVAS